MKSVIPALLFLVSVLVSVPTPVTPAPADELPPLPPIESVPPVPERPPIEDPRWAEIMQAVVDGAAKGKDWDTAARAAWLLVRSDDGTGRLRWVSDDGEPVWSASIDSGSGRLGRAGRLLHLAGRDDLAEPLLRRALILGQPIDAEDGLRPSTFDMRARTWHLPLDPLTFHFVDEEPVSSGDLIGKVLVLDFWASWCAPCRDELPRMQAFHEKNATRGLVTYAVNVGEPREISVPAAKTLNLRLPLVDYTDELKEAFSVERLPTVILIDREGKIRGRWELFKDGTEENMFWAIEQMLEAESGAGESIARRVTREEVLQVRWMREFQGNVDAVVPVSRPGHETRVNVCYGRKFLALEPNGKTETKLSGDLVSGRLVPSLADAEGNYTLLSYRLGGTRISRFDLPAAETVTWEAPAPVFDVQWVDPANPARGAVLATLEGLAVLDGEGQLVNTMDIGLVRGIARESGGWKALTGDGQERTWLTLGEDLERRSERPLEGAPWRLEGTTESSRMGLLEPSIKAFAVGRFLDAERKQVAVAGEGQLVLLDESSGTEVFRAHWDGIQTLTAGDLDGDAVDELFVAWGNRIAVLGKPLESE